MAQYDDGLDYDGLNAAAGGDLDFGHELDFSDSDRIGNFIDGWYPMRITDLRAKRSKEKYNEKSGQVEGNKRYLEVDLLCIGGKNTGQGVTDKPVMCEGKGITRLKAILMAADLWDEAGQRMAGSVGDLLEREVWVELENKVEVGKDGRKFPKCTPTYTGYAPIGSRPFPGAEEETNEEAVPPAAAPAPVAPKPAPKPAPAPAPAPAAPKPAPRPAPKPAPVEEPAAEPEWEEGEIGDVEPPADDEAFVADAAGEVTVEADAEIDAEVEEEAPAPALVTRPARAGTAGGKPPWMKS